MKPRQLSLVLAIGALALTSCQNDEVLDDAVARGDAISYSVSAANQTRSLESYCSNYLPSKVSIAAAEIGSETAYFQDELTKSGTSYSTATTHYFPASGSLNFFAWVKNCESGTFDFNKGAPLIKDFKVAASAADQVDLLYAVHAGVAKGTTVNVNLRHALSQVVFKAQNLTNMTVKIKSVAVGHLKDQGTLTFPTTSTAQGYNEHPANGNTSTPTAADLWGTTATGNAEYKVELTDPQPITSTAVDLTTANHEGTKDNSLILMPQSLAAWNPATKVAGGQGAYFLLDVEMTQNGVNVYTGKAAVPVDIEWNPGVRYTYTFLFSSGGTGGYNPDPEGNEPEPVLSNISFSLTYDDFVPAEQPETDMDGEFPVTVPVKYFDAMYGSEDYDTQVQTGSVSGLLSKTFKLDVNSQYKELSKKNEPAENNDYQFKGWSLTKPTTYSTADNSIETITNPFTFSTSNPPALGGYTFYAVWEPQEYELNYSVNFGKPDPDYGNNQDINGNDIKTDRVAKDISNGKWSFTVTELIPKPKDTNTTHVFVGWNENADDAKKGIVSHIGGSTLVYTQPNGNKWATRIYGVWVNKTDGKVTYVEPAANEIDAKAAAGYPRYTELETSDSGTSSDPQSSKRRR